MSRSKLLEKAQDAFLFERGKVPVRGLYSREKGIFYPVSDFVGEGENLDGVLVLWAMSYDDESTIDIIFIDTQTMKSKYAIYNIEEIVED